MPRRCLSPPASTSSAERDAGLFGFLLDPSAHGGVWKGLGLRTWSYIK